LSAAAGLEIIVRVAADTPTDGFERAIATAPAQKLHVFTADGRQRLTI